MLDIMHKFFYLGGIFTTSLFCFLTLFTRRRDKLFLGYGFFTLSSTLLFLTRRVMPLVFPGEGYPWIDVISLAFTECCCAAGLYYFLSFFGINRQRRAFGFFIGALLATAAVMLAAIFLLLAGRGNGFSFYYHISVFAFIVSGLLYVIRALALRRAAFRMKKRLLLYLGAVFVYLIALSLLNAFNPFFSFSFILPGLYALLISFYFLHGYKLNQDYVELIGLKNELEEKVRVRTEQVEELHRKKQRFFITITHETKTPLTLVAACLERYMASAPFHPDLDLMKRTLDSLRANLANHLVFEKLLSDVAHFEHDQVIDFSWLLREKAALFQPLALKKGLSLETSLPGALSIAADPAALDQVINNLLDNAVKYTKPGGFIMAELRERRANIVLSIKDTGIGISPTMRESVFDPFRQGSHKGGDVQGIGMGLAIVKQIVDGIGGEISVKSRSPEACQAAKAGDWVTEIEVAFPGNLVVRKPVSQEVSAFVTSKPLDTAAPSAESFPLEARTEHDPELPTVLLVEDNADLLHFLVSSLSGRFNAYGAADGRDALEKIEAMPKPDVVVSDIMMPHMDGYAFFTALQELPRFNDVPFIFLTAVSSPMERLRGLSGGAIDFITKPLASIADLEAKIVSLLGFLKRRSERTKGDVFDKLRRAIAEEQSDLPLQERLIKENMAAFGFTDRERLIVECLREGLQNKEISARLGISTRTVDNHLYNVFRKAGSQNRVGLLNRIVARR